MKKFLSLVLALVMAMSLVTVSAGAKDFDDSDKISGVAYEEAVNVMSEMGIIDGYGDGNFQPQGTLTRGAAAKIIACMMLGKTTAEALGTQAAPFKDVPVGSTFAGYIAYCSESGIIDGYADGTFRPGNTLTGFAFLKMLLTALGYDSEIEQYANNPNWTVNVAGRAKQIGLVDGNENFVGTKAATREEACLYAVNALQATLVEYTDKGANITIGDTTISTGASNATYVTSNVYDQATSINSTTDNGTIWTVEFAEKYQPKLALRHDTDDFMRPAHTWTWDKKEIGTYVEYDKMVAEYTEKVTGKEVYELLTATTISENELLSYVDGGEGTVEEADLVRSNNSGLDDTGNGVLTQIFVDNARNEITIASINTWLAQATSDYNSSTEMATLKIFTSYDEDRWVTNSTTQNVDVEDVPAVADLKKDDFVLVNQSIKERARLEVVAIAEPEILEDCTVTAFSKSKEDDHDASGADAKGLYESVTTGGEKYDGAKMANYDASVLNEYDADLLKDNSYNVYLDQYGYIIGLDLYEGTKNYVFITGYNRTVDSNISVDTSKAAAIFLDGQIKPITVNVKDTNKNIEAVYEKADYAPYFDRTRSNAGDALWVAGGEPNENKWYTYTVDDDGVYTLKPVKQQSATAVADIPGVTGAPGTYTGTIDCSRVYLPDSYRGGTATYAYGDDESVYIVVSQGEVDTTNDKAITEVDGVYTGVQDVKIEIDEREINSNAATNLNANQYHVDPIYTVYDGDGYVIASVVLGEAQGSVKNYAYILSGATGEKIVDGVTYWTFDAIMGGKKVELTIQDKFGNTVQNLVPYSVQELMFTGDYVTKIENVDDEDQVNCALQQISAGDQSVYDVVFDNYLHGTGTSTDDYTDSDYQVPVNGGALGTDNTTIRLNIRTLYTTLMTGAAAVNHATPAATHDDKDEPVGLTFVSGAPAVVIQVVNGKNTTTEYASVEEALGAMADADTGAAGQQFRGRIVAVLNDMGVAEWVVFISATPVAAGTGTTTPAPTNAPAVTVNKATQSISAGFLAGTPAQAKYAAVVSALNNAGISFNFVDPAMNYVIDTDGKWWPIVETEFYKLTIDNAVSYIQKASSGDTTLGKVLDLTKGSRSGEGYVITAGLDNSGAIAAGYYDYEATAGADIPSTTKIKGHVTITTGYVEIPAAATDTSTVADDITLSNTDGYIKVGSSLTVTYTYNKGNVNVPAGNNYTATLNVNGAAYAAKALSGDDVQANKVTLSFTISNITSEITTINLAYALKAAPVSVTTTGLAGTFGSGEVTATVVSAPATAEVGDSFKVTVALSGNVTARRTLTLSTTTGTTAAVFNAATAPQGMAATGTTLTIEAGAYDYSTVEILVTNVTGAVTLSFT